MEWCDEGILLNARPHGENAVIVEVFTPEHGRHIGVVRGGTGRKIVPILQPGAQLDVAWRARLEEHIGTFAVELIRSRAAQSMSDRVALAGLNSVTALLSFGLPEREPHLTLYDQSARLLDLLDQPELWPLAYLRWEMHLLEVLGFGLDLSCCAATGRRENLIYVSPRSGRSVSEAGAGVWANRLLALPRCMLGQGAASDSEVAQALGTTGHFLHHHLAEEILHKPVPRARERFLDQLSRRINIG
ncbi:MAG: DNA repair protein RecO [Paracoccaceae bacterium]|jgi:DNA repair protein RecO (recombination protein O)|nr:DNA repair protein RecO [Paracoccaceae bacterium]